MLITVTQGVVNAKQHQEVERFLRDFLPRLKRRQPGVIDAFHFHDESAQKSTTLILWQDENARNAYRESELIKEAMAIEQRLGLSTSREAYPVTISTRDAD
jgi:heme-degrading monooxygenase HmoA